MFVLNARGKRLAADYIKELESKRKEILDAGKDTANTTTIPSLSDIEEDVNFIGLDENGEYYNGWSVTDHYEADYPLLLKLSRDIVELADIPLIGFVYKHGENDYELWQHGIPERDLLEVEKILAKYALTGYGVRGTARNIGEELEGM